MAEEHLVSDALATVSRDLSEHRESADGLSLLVEDGRVWITLNGSVNGLPLDPSGDSEARLVEVAALTQALKTMGHDPAKDFNDRLIASMTAQAEVPTTKIKPVERDAAGPAA